MNTRHHLCNKEMKFPKSGNQSIHKRSLSNKTGNTEN